ncbi:MAG: hypothetical protein ACK4RV_11440 [Caulobacter sp.]|jgi:choline-glycine betaine transporter
MQQGPTLKEMIAHRPLVIAWAWELVCILGAVAVMLTTERVELFVALVLVGAAPFAFVLLRFLRLHKAGALPHQRGGGIVQ